MIRFRPTARFLHALCFLACATAHAQTPAIEFTPQIPAGEGAGPGALNFSYGREELSNDSPDWTETILKYQHRFGKRHFLEGGIAQTERFDLDDTRFMALYGVPLNAALTATVLAEYSDTHRVLPETLFEGVLQYEFAQAWLLHGGARTTRYDDVRVNQGFLMLEHYFGNFSASVAWRPARAFGITAHSYEFRAAYYYSDKSSVVFSFAEGEEATNVGTGVVIADVRSYAVFGRHAWEPGPWALRYGWNYVEQGDFYDRRGLTLGIEYAF